MAPLPPAVAAVRLAVRRALTSHLSGGTGEPLVLVACSGGADSLALAVATGFVAPRLGLRCGLVTVDHGLQSGSADRAAAIAAWGCAAGLAPVRAVAVEVAGRPGGPEAAAREARYQALAAVARDAGAAAVLLGHTRDDQAETVLLALARGAGPRGLSGMPELRVVHGMPFLRPLLGVARAETRAACEDLAVEPWDDPHNTDPAYTRSRLRAAMPVLTGALGRGIVGNLARTAALVAEDTALLDAMAAEAAAGITAEAAAAGGALSVPALAALPGALRRRVLHRWCRDLGAGGSALSHRHVAALDALVVAWRGQGPASLPGGVRVRRRAGRLVPDPGADPVGDVRQS